MNKLTIRKPTTIPPDVYTPSNDVYDGDRLVARIRATHHMGRHQILWVLGCSGLNAEKVPQSPMLMEEIKSTIWKLWSEIGSVTMGVEIPSVD